MSLEHKSGLSRDNIMSRNITTIEAFVHDMHASNIQKLIVNLEGVGFGRILDLLRVHVQLEQVHLACRTQLLLPGLVAVVHHVHVHHVTWECHI